MRTPRSHLLALSLCLAALAPSAAAAGNTKVVFDAPDCGIEEFRAFAAKAASLGATHVVISNLPKSRWQWDADRTDPYPNWGMLQASIFKVVVPPELAPWLPADYARANLAIVRARGAILRQLGLKAVFNGIEPSWLPEGAFEAHPDWRGPRCDHPVRSRHSYYAPCVDRPEVLAMYRRAVAELCRAAPIDSFWFITNDSGGGFCWSASLYPGMNGPSWCEGRTMAGRMTGFFSAIQAGAGDAGQGACVAAQYGAGVIARAEVDSVVASLLPGQSLNGRTRDGSADTIPVGRPWVYNVTYPVMDVPEMEEMAAGLEAALDHPSSQALISLQADEAPWTWDLIARYRAHPIHGYAARLALIRAVAADYAGGAEADNLLEAFHGTSVGVAALAHVGGDAILCIGDVNQRWITRPFVPLPLKLTPAERADYRPFQFQANGEEEAARLINTQGNEFYGGYSGALLSGAGLDWACEEIGGAAARFEASASRVRDPAKRDRLAVTGARLRALVCLCRTAENAIKYQSILDGSRLDRTVRQSTEYPLDGDQRLRDLQAVTRREVDNTNELATLLEANRGRLLVTAATPTGEDVFLLNPDLVPQLRRKVRAMLEHERDADRYFQRRQG
jgi:hypothetical protein